MATAMGNANPVYEVLAKAAENRKTKTESRKPTTYNPNLQPKTDKAPDIVVHRCIDGTHSTSYRWVGDPSYSVGTSVV